jgi:crotonobetainyl-CoA:carnitine CoA-transferase CaiB-like acyl-CoA transferase
VVASPVRLSKTPAKTPTPSPILGQHTRDVLHDVLGLTSDQIDGLAAAGAVGTAKRSGEK